jgi:hypothetical protein
MPVGRPSRRPVFSVLLTVFVAVASLAPALPAQTMHYGVVMDRLRDGLADRWSEDLHQVERAYCVTQWWAAVSTRRAPVAADTGAGRAASDDAGVDTVFRVLEVRPADATEATPNGATFACPTGQPELHTHPPATCYADRQDQCYHGGTDAYSCQPSREDVRTLRQRGDEFAIVQCDRNAFVFYYPSQYDTGHPVALSAIPSVFSIAARTHTDAAQTTAAGPAGPGATPH